MHRQEVRDAHWLGTVNYCILSHVYKPQTVMCW